ncbi:MAG: beta-ketoacyl synthase, partial [Mesorhizobium sp.]
MIVGIGARTPLGFSAEASAAAVRAGISAIQDHPYMIDRVGERMKVTLDSGIDAALNGPDRAVAIAVGPALDALAPLRMTDPSVPVALILS